MSQPRPQWFVIKKNNQPWWKFNLFESKLVCARVCPICSTNNSECLCWFSFISWNIISQLDWEMPIAKITRMNMKKSHSMNVRSIWSADEISNRKRREKKPWNILKNHINQWNIWRQKQKQAYRVTEPKQNSPTPLQKKKNRHTQFHRHARCHCQLFVHWCLRG